MQLRASSYGLNIHFNFLKLFVELENHINFVGIQFLFQSVVGSKNYGIISRKRSSAGNKRKSQKVKINFNFNFFSNITFFLYV